MSLTAAFLRRQGATAAPTQGRQKLEDEITITILTFGIRVVSPLRLSEVNLICLGRLQYYGDLHNQISEENLASSYYIDSSTPIRAKIYDQQHY